MAKPRSEEVSGSFHYLMRTEKSGKLERLVPFRESDFTDLYGAIRTRPVLDLTDDQMIDKLRFNGEAPLEKVKLENTRLITGTFRGLYSGHSYENTKKGTIPADSVSLRPFHFILYLSDSGKIYIGCQYLGQFGGYQSLQRTIVNLLPNSKSIRAHSFRLGAGFYKNAHPKEIRVNVASKSASLAQKSTVGGKMTIALSQQSKNDPLGPTLKRSLFHLIGGRKDDMQRAVADLMKQTQILDIDEDDIQDCVVLAELNGKQRVIHMFEAGHHASKFPLNVKTNSHGHPAQEETCSAIVKVLQEHVLAATEDG